MKQNYKKTTNIDYYYYLPSINHFKFMEITYHKGCRGHFSWSFSRDPSICPVIHPWMASYKEENPSKKKYPPPLHMCCCLEKACPSPGGGTPKILILISTINPTYILYTMLEDIQKHMHALIAQHGSVLAALVAFRQ
jgi:hypothetical protein